MRCPHRAAHCSVPIGYPYRIHRPSEPRLRGIRKRIAHLAVSDMVVRAGSHTRTCRALFAPDAQIERQRREEVVVNVLGAEPAPPDAGNDQVEGHAAEVSHDGAA